MKEEEFDALLERIYEDLPELLSERWPGIESMDAKQLRELALLTRDVLNSRADELEF